MFFAKPKLETKLKREILNEVPQLAQALKHDRVYALSLIRDWIANRVPWSVSELELTRQHDGFFDKDLTEIEKLFRSETGGVLCGGMAYYGCLIYRLFGYDAVFYNYGLKGVFTHVVILVACSRNRKTSFYIQDPAFNLHYQNTLTSEPMQFEELLQKITNREFDGIALAEKPIRGRFYMLPVNRTEKVNYRMGESPAAKPEKIVNDIAFYKDRFTYKGFLNTRKYPEKVKAYSGEEDAHRAFLRLLIYPINPPSFKKKFHERNFRKILKARTYLSKEGGVVCSDDAESKRFSLFLPGIQKAKRPAFRKVPPQKEATEAWLERTIFFERPELRTVLRDNPLQAAVLIRDWAANRITAAVPELQLNKIYPRLREKSLPEFDALLVSCAGGVMCGGGGHYCAKLYQLLGIDAATYNFGIPGLFTHVVAITAIDGELYVQDQTFNHHYIEGASSVPLPFNIMLQKIREEDWSGIRREALPIQGRKYIAPAEKIGKNYRTLEKHLVKTEKGIAVFKDNFSFENFFRISVRSPVLRSRFEDEDIARCLLRLYLRPLSFGRFGNPRFDSSLQNLFSELSAFSHD